MNGLNDLERVPVAKQSDEQVKKFVSELRQRCYDAMNDDFQTQLVISYLFEACHVINAALDHKANISAEDLKELSDTMHLFTFDLLGLKSEKGANNDAREEAIFTGVPLTWMDPASAAFCMRLRLECCILTERYLSMRSGSCPLSTSTRKCS